MLSEIQENFETLRNFEKEVNEEKAHTVDLKVIKFVRDLLPHLPFQPDIFEDLYGGIQLEYINKDDFLNIDIKPDNTMEIFKDKDFGDTKHSCHITNEENITQEIYEFFGISKMKPKVLVSFDEHRYMMKAEDLVTGKTEWCRYHEFTQKEDVYCIIMNLLNK